MHPPRTLWRKPSSVITGIRAVGLLALGTLASPAAQAGPFAGVQVRAGVLTFPVAPTPQEDGKSADATRGSSEPSQSTGMNCVQAHGRLGWHTPFWLSVFAQGGVARASAAESLPVSRFELQETSLFYGLSLGPVQTLQFHAYQGNAKYTLRQGAATPGSSLFSLAGKNKKVGLALTGTNSLGKKQPNRVPRYVMIGMGWEQSSPSSATPGEGGQGIESVFLTFSVDFEFGSEKNNNFPFSAFSL